MAHPLREHVIARFANEWASAQPNYKARAIEFLTDAYDRFKSAGLADRHFEQELLLQQGYSYWQREAEILLADMLWKDGFSLEGADLGPDLRATKNGVSLWIELHTPTPAGVPADHLTLPSATSRVRSFPYKEINLRWTSAMKEKAEKLLGIAQSRGYLAEGTVKANEIFVIAINQHLLHRSFRSLSGISRYPAPVEVLFAVGPLSLSIDVETLKTVDQGHLHQPFITKPNGAAVPTDTFLDRRYAPVSAMFGLDLMVEACIDHELQHILPKEHLSALVYNPLALNPVPPKLISAQEHWICHIDSDQHVVERI